MSFFFSCRPPLLSRPSRIRKKKRGGGIWLSSPLLPCLPRFPFFFCFAYLASCERVRERASPAREERMSGGKLESERGMLAKRHWRRSNQHQGKKKQGKQRKKKKNGRHRIRFAACLPLFHSGSSSPLCTMAEPFLRSLQRARRLTECARKYCSSYHLKLLARKVAVSCDGRHFLFLSFAAFPFLSRSLGPALSPSLCELNALAVPFLSALSVPTREKERREGSEKSFFSFEMQSKERRGREEARKEK